MDGGGHCFLFNLVVVSAGGRGRNRPYGSIVECRIWIPIGPLESIKCKLY